MWAASGWIYICRNKICCLQIFQNTFKEAIKYDLVKGTILRVIHSHLLHVFKRSIRDLATDNNFTLLVINVMNNKFRDTGFETWL